MRRLTLLTLFLTATPAFAHKLVLTVTPAPPDRLQVRAGYDDGTPAEGATVTVADPTGAEVGRGVLDERGGCALPCPAGGWTVTVDDGAGHRARASGNRETPPSVRTMPGRWLMAAAGLALIGGWAGWRRVARR